MKLKLAIRAAGRADSSITAPGRRSELRRFAFAPASIVMKVAGSPGDASLSLHGLSVGADDLAFAIGSSSHRYPQLQALEISPARRASLAPRRAVGAAMSINIRRLAAECRLVDKSSRRRCTDYSSAETVAEVFPDGHRQRFGWCEACASPSTCGR